MIFNNSYGCVSIGRLSSRFVSVVIMRLIWTNTRSVVDYATFVAWYGPEMWTHTQYNDGDNAVLQSENFYHDLWNWGENRHFETLFHHLYPDAIGQVINCKYFFTIVKVALVICNSAIN